MRCCRHNDHWPLECCGKMEIWITRTLMALIHGETSNVEFCLFLFYFDYFWQCDGLGSHNLCCRWIYHDLPVPCCPWITVCTLPSLQKKMFLGSQKAVLQYSTIATPWISPSQWLHANANDQVLVSIIVRIVNFHTCLCPVIMHFVLFVFTIALFYKFPVSSQRIYWRFIHDVA